jgi:hypothetical protein
MRKFNIASLILAGLLAFAPAAFARGEEEATAEAVTSAGADISLGQATP